MAEAVSSGHTVQELPLSTFTLPLSGPPDLGHLDVLVIFCSYRRELHGWIPWLQEQGVHVVYNATHALSPIGRDTYRFHILKQAGIRVPDGFLVHSSWEQDVPADFLPAVVKRLGSSSKTGVAFAKTQEEVQAAMKALGHKRSSFQLTRYIAHVREWRVTVVNGQPIAVLERHGTAHDFLSSFREQATRLGLTPEEAPEVSALATRVASLLSFDLLGVDVIEDIDTGELVVIDLNAIPAFKVSETYTGINIAGAIVDGFETIVHTKKHG